MNKAEKPQKVTYEQYIQITNKDEKHWYEYIDGVIYMMGIPSPLHERISTQIDC